MLVAFEVFESIFVSILSFCSSIIKKVSKKRNIYFAIKFILHLIFAGAISILLGFIGTIFGLLAVSPFFPLDFLSSYHAFLPLTLFLFTCLSGITWLNWSNRSYNLPNLLFICYSIIVLNNPKNTVIQAIGFLLFFTLIITGVISFTVLYLYASIHSEINKQLVNNIMFMCLSFSFLLSVIIFSYGTMKEIERLLRQFYLWLLILISILIFSAYQFYIKLQSPINELVTTEIVLLVVGLIFTITTVADKGKELFQKLFLKDKRMIGFSWYQTNKKFSAVSVYSRLKINAKNIYSEYLALKPTKRIILLVLIFVGFALKPVIIKILDRVNSFIAYIAPIIENKVWTITVSVHSGNIEQAKILLMLIFLVFLLACLLIRYIYFFKSYNLTNKLLYIG
ncbi:hypothetical protein ACWGPW_27230, partial [Paenibacillus chitinolyticus]